MTAQSDAGPEDALVATRLADGFVLVDDSTLLDSQAPFRGLLVPEPHASQFYFGDHGRAVSHWTPRVADAMALAKALRARDWKDQPHIGSSLHDYRFQLVGVVVGERRLLYANAFCRGGDDWTRTPVVVDDGGDCYFQLSFDPAEGIIVKLTVNGEA